MRDWTAIDRDLEQLGPAPKDVAGLIARVLGPDRSPSALEAALVALGAEPAPVVVPPAPPAAERRPPSARPLSSFDTNEQWPPESEPPRPREEDLDSATEALLGDGDDEPRRSIEASEPPPAPPVSARALLDRELDPSDFPSRPPQRIEMPPPAADAAGEDDFEMLIEDEEILEIQEDDVETDEGDEG